MRHRVRFEVRPSGVLAVALLYFFSDIQILAALLGSIIIHELGHAVALRLWGAKVRVIRLDMAGLCIDYNSLHLTRFQEGISAAAGPAMGALTAWTTSFLGNWFDCSFLLLFAGTSLILTIFNLIPAKPLDGWRILSSIFPNAAEPVSLFSGMATLFTGLWCMKAGYGPGLAVMGIILLLYDTAPMPRKCHPA